MVVPYFLPGAAAGFSSRLKKVVNVQEASTVSFGP
jgi:hypothetical protein